MAVDARFVGSVEITAAAATAATSSGTTSATGSTFVVFASTTDTAFAATPITDNKGNTYTLIGTVTTDATFTTTTGYWRAENGAGGSGHIATVHNNASGLVSAFLIEVTSAASSNVLDVHNENNVVAASPFTSASVTTTKPNEVVLAFELDNRNAVTAPTWGNSYTSLGDLSNTSGITANVAKLVVSSTGAQQSSFTDAAVTRAITWIATFTAPVIPRVLGRSPDQGPGVQAAGAMNQFTSSPRSSFIFPPPAPPPPVVAMPIRNPGPFNNAQFQAGPLGFTPATPATTTLSGQTATFTEGTIGLEVDYALTGQTATFSLGTITPTITYVLNGQTATFTEGAIGPEVDYGLTAQTAAFTEGTITSQVAGDVTIQLSGLQAAFTLGQITASGGDSTQTTGSNPGGGGGGGGWSSKFEFSTHKRQPDEIEAQSAHMFHVEPEHVTSVLPDDSLTILSNALAFHARDDDNDDEEAITLLLQ